MIYKDIYYFKYEQASYMYDDKLDTKKLHDLVVSFNPHNIIYHHYDSIKHRCIIFSDDNVCFPPTYAGMPLKDCLKSGIFIHNNEYSILYQKITIINLVQYAWFRNSEQREIKGFEVNEYISMDNRLSNLNIILGDNEG